MVQGQLIKYPNILKWILQTKSGISVESDKKWYFGISVESEQFVIQNCKCCFSFCYGINTRRLSESAPLSLMIRLNDNQKPISPMEVSILVSSSSKTFPPERHTIAGECEVKIWSSFDYTIRGSLLTFEMITYDSMTHLKDDKEVQTPSYIDINVQLGAVSKDFASLLNTSSNHDVEFLCGQESFKAHKDVICCRSTVFASMLGTDMQEGKTGQIKIHDMESSILNQFLLYLYTGVFPESTFDTILRMYQAADKYAVDSLKEQCASFLIDNLSHETACEVLVLSDKHNDLDLKKVVIEYVLKEKIPRRIGKKWIDFCKENQNLAIEVLNTHYLDFCEADHVSEKQ